MANNESNNIFIKFKQNLPIAIVIASIITTWAYFQFSIEELKTDVQDLKIETQRISLENQNFKVSISSDIAEIKTSILFIKEKLEK